MTAFEVTTCLIIVAYYAGTVTGHGWKYGTEESWATQCRDGKRQSPIALSQGIASAKSFPPIVFEKIKAEYPANLKNNGHSAEIRLHVEEKPTIKGGGLPSTYVLDHLHFHWESEHTINGHRCVEWPHSLYPLELHIVSYAEKYKNLTEAVRSSDGIAVFAVLFELSPDDDDELNPLVHILKELHDINRSEQMVINIGYYIPRNIAGFYQYSGSLTTPDCNEVVIWTVFTNSLPISQHQVKSFASLEGSGRSILTKNYRSLQPLNNRMVYLKTSPMLNYAPPQFIFMFALLVVVFGVCIQLF